jgi:hypothetical protein
MTFPSLTLADFDANVRRRSKRCLQLCQFPFDRDTHREVTLETTLIRAFQPNTL